MLSNYLKLALRVLSRKKFFTFITLFGISFTLMMLMVFSSYVETELGNNPPLSKKDKMVILRMLSLEKVYYDTIPTVDTVQLDGIEKYDTTYAYNNVGRSISRSLYSEYFFNTFLNDLENIEDRTIINNGYVFDIYRNNSKISLKVGFCDYNYWDVFDYKFIEGRNFDKSAFDNGEQVVVITENLAKKYFGSITGTVGKEIKFDGRNFKVIGIVATPSTSFRLVDADVYAPYTLRRSDPSSKKDEYFGGFSGIFVANTPAGIKSIKDQLSFKEKNTPIPPDLEYNVVSFTPMSFTEYFARGIIPFDDVGKSKRVLMYVLIGVLLLFILLPTLNLINLNVSRILERSSEIGVRKAFGANRSNILTQFVFENIIQTFLGGIIGLFLAILAIKLINESQILENVKLVINFNFFLLSVLITLIFGVLSGLLPAYKMSKVQIVNALKSNQL